MNNCSFTLNVEGQEMKFFSENELNDFLQKHYDVLSSNKPLTDFAASKVTSNGTYSSAELVYNKLKKEAEEVEEMKSVIGPNGEKSEEYNQYVGITRRIQNLVKTNPGLGLIYFSEDNYRKNKLEALKVQLDANKGITDPHMQYLATLKKDLDYKLKRMEITEEYYKQQIDLPLLTSIQKDISNWKKLARFGTDLHAMSEAFFNHKLNKATDPFTIDMFPKEGDMALQLTDDIKINYLNYLNNLYASLENFHGENIIVIPEYKMLDKNSKVIGVVDLLVIDAEGNTHIYDFKASYKEPRTWHTAKRRTYYYQLGAYRNMLQNKGISVKTLAVIPLVFDDIDFDANTVKNVRYNPVEELRHSDFGIGIQTGINVIVPSTSAGAFQSDSSSKDIGDFLKEALDYNIVLKSALTNVDTFIKNNVKPDSDPKYMRYWDRTLMGPVKVLPENVRSSVEDYFKRDAESALSSFYAFKNEWVKVLNRDLSFNNVSFGKSTTATKRKEILRRAFKRYSMGSWVLVENDTVLDQLGLLMFVNEQANGKRVVEFVSFTANDLFAKVSLNGRNTLLGKFLPDSFTEKYPKLLEATNGNIELIKILAYIESNKNQFLKNNFVVGRMAAYNESTLDFHTETLDKLVYNYDFLTRRMQRSNGLMSIKSVSTFDLLLDMFNTVRGEEKLDDYTLAFLNNGISAIQDKTDTGKLEVLTGLEGDLRKILIESGQFSKLTQFDTPEKILYARIQQAITEENKVALTAEQDMTEFMRLFGSPGDTTSEGANIIAGVMETAMQHVRNKHLEFRRASRVVADKFLTEQGFPRIRRNTLGDISSAYNNMFEKNVATGEVNSDLILKNPYDSNSKLTNNEREYLKYFLNKLNTIRFGNGDPNSDIGQVKVESGEWFLLPLMRGSSFNKMFKRDLGSRITDYMDTLIDPAGLFDLERKEYDKHLAEGMFEMVNSFDVQKLPEGRHKLIASEKLGAFETDLEVVLDFYAFSETRRNEYNKVLPKITSMKIAMAYQGYELGIDLATTLKYIDKQTENVLYARPHIEPENQKAMKIIRGVKDVASYMNMSMNPVAGVANYMTGFWGNLSRLMARTYGKEMFGYKEFTSAFGFVFKDSFKSMANLTWLEELNMLYSLNNMDMNQYAERVMENRSGYLQLKSSGLFWFMTAPDYFNRMVLFTAQMKKDGCFEAHSMQDGVMVYDFKKDKRFSAFASNDTTNPEYNNQRALYYAMREDFIKEGYDIPDGGPLPMAYNNKQRNSLKAFADSIHGHYDHSTKVQANYTVLGTMFLQFKTWLIAKKNQYMSSRVITQQGNYQQVEVDGIKYFQDADGNPTTEDTGFPLWKWEGRPMEGILVSFTSMFKELRENDYKLNVLGEMIKDPFRSNPNNPTRASNMRLFMADMAIVFLIWLLFHLVDFKSMKEDSPLTYQAANAVFRSSQDGNIMRVMGTALSNEPIASFSYFKDIYDGFWNTLTGDEKFGHFLLSNTGATRVFASPIMKELTGSSGAGAFIPS